MSAEIRHPHPLDALAEEFVARCRRGERPQMAEYCAKYPELAAEIQELFPVLLLMEQGRGPDAALPDQSAPTVSLEQLQQRLLDAGLLPVEDLQTIVARMPAERHPITAETLALELCRQEKLTRYQAIALCQPEPTTLRLGDYVILDRLGAGGMGVVFKAVHRRMKRIVALKLLAPTLAPSRNVLQRFQREVEAAARLLHPNIVAAYDAGEDRGIPYLVLEHVAGSDLASRVQLEGPLSVTDAIAVVLQAARGLAYAHQQGVVHRDIKPGNLLLADGQGGPGSRPDSVKVLDLGLARFYSDMKAQEAENSASESPRNDASTQQREMTRTGSLLGTASFMAPEQAHDPRTADHRADIYSLGCTLFFLLCGKPLFDADTTVAMVQAHRQQPAPKLRSNRPEVPEALETVFQRMVAKEPASRQQSMAEVMADLERAQRRPFRPRRIDLLLLSSFVLLLGVSAILAGRYFFPRVEELGPAAVPLDQLRREAISPYELRVAGQGDPNRAPPELAAILGDSRLKHWYFVTSLAFSPDGQTLASGSWDNTVKIWDTATGEERHTLTGEGGWMFSVAFRRDGQTLVSGDRLGHITLWDAATGARNHTFPPEKFSIWWVGFSPDGQALAAIVGKLDETASALKVWDVTAGLPQRNLKWQVHGARCFAFRADSAAVVTGDIDRSVRLRDMATGEERRRGPRHESAIGSIAFNPAGDLVASGDEKGLIKLWEVQTGQERPPLEGHKAKIKVLVFDPSGKTLASASRDGTIRLWDMATGQLLRVLKGHSGGVTALAFSPDGKTLASGAEDHAIKLWDPATGTEKIVPEGHRGAVRSVAFSPFADQLLSGGADGAVLLWDAAAARFRHKLAGHASAVTSVAISPNGTILASAAEDATAQLSEAGAVRTLKGHGASLRALVFSPDGREVATASQDGSVKLWDPLTGRERRTLGGGNVPVNGLAFRPDGGELAAAVGDYIELRRPGQVRRWQLPDGTERPPLRDVTGCFMTTAFSLDGQLLAFAGIYPDNGVRLWDSATDQLRFTLSGHGNACFCVAFSTDGQTLASSGSDGNVRLWNSRTGAEQQTISLGPPGGGIGWVAFSFDGHYLATANGNGTIYILRLPPTSGVSR
jgi:WD40 repeat protein/serine/threonine protein kinase